MRIKKQDLFLYIISIVSILISLPYLFYNFGTDANESTITFGVGSLILGLILILAKFIEKYSKTKEFEILTTNSILSNLALLAIIQIVPSILWFMFNNTTITDSTSNTGFIARWFYSIPHIFISVLAIILLVERYKAYKESTTS